MITETACPAAGTVLVRVSSAVANQYELGEERAYFSFHVHHQRQSLMAGTWKQELLQRSGGVLLSDLLLVACSSSFLVSTNTISSAMALPTVSWSLPHQSNILQGYPSDVRMYTDQFVEDFFFS